MALGLPASDLLCRFSRLWTMQEAVLAKSLLIICGSDITSWENIVRCTKSQFNTTPRAQSLADHRKNGIATVERIESLRQWRSASKRLTERQPYYLVEILQLMVTQDCFLPVDRVFAVLGLFPRDVITKVTVRYSAQGRRLDHRVVYAEFTNAILGLQDDQQGVVKSVIEALQEESAKGQRAHDSRCPDFSKVHKLIKAGKFNFLQQVAMYRGLQPQPAPATKETVREESTIPQMFSHPWDDQTNSSTTKTTVMQINKDILQDHDLCTAQTQDNHCSGIIRDYDWYAAQLQDYSSRSKAKPRIETKKKWWRR